MSRSLQRFGCNGQFSCTHTALLELAVVGRSGQTEEHCSTHGHAEGRSLPGLCLSPLRQDGSGTWLIRGASGAGCCQEEAAGFMLGPEALLCGLQASCSHHGRQRGPCSACLPQGSPFCAHTPEPVPCSRPEAVPLATAHVTKMLHQES